MPVKTSPKYLDKFESSEPDMFHKIYFELTRPYLSGKRILNIGCWTGSYETMFEQVDSDLVSIDLNFQALQIATKSSPHSNFLAADTFKLPFKKESFDAATLFTVLEHLPIGSEEKAFKEINGVLKKGGLFFITTPNDNFIGNLFDVAYWLVGHRHYKIGNLSKMLNNCGFRVEKVLLKGRFWNNFSIVFFYLFKYLFALNIYRNKSIERILKKEYAKEGYRDIILLAIKN